MKLFHLLLSFLFVSQLLPAQTLKKAIEKKFENGKPEIIAWYDGEVAAEKLARREVYGVDGEKIEEKSYKNGKLHGKSTKWKPFDGSVEWEYNYENGEKHGKQIEYFSDGTVKTELNYLVGKLDGEQKGYYLKDHAPRFSFNLSAGVYHGPQEEINPDGSKKYRLNFLAGKLDGIQRWYLPPNGEVKQETWKQGVLEEAVESHSASQPKVVKVFEFKVDDPENLTVSGEKVLIKEMGYYKSGAIEYITELTGDEPTTRMLHLSGQPKAEGKGGIGSEEGKWTYFHANGKKMMEGEYVNGQKSGNWTIWNDKEKVLFEEVWKTGSDPRGEKYLRTSCKVILYFPNGDIQSEGFLDPEDKKTGNWIHHYANGEVKREESYVVNCTEKGARPFAETILHYDEDGNKVIEGSERKQTRYEYHGNGKVKIETEVILPCHDRCSKEKYEYYQDGEMKMESTGKVDGKSCKMDDMVVLKRTEYRESGDKVSVESFNEEGIIDGVQEGWYNNGKKKFEYTYKNGKPEGAIKEWYDTGQAMLDLTYHVVDGRIVELKSGTIYTDNGKDYFYEQSEGKDMKKKAQEVFDLSFWKKYMAEH